jgi:hypothetical protein
MSREPRERSWIDADGRPMLGLRKLFHSLAGQITALDLKGCTPEQADRIVVAAAQAKVNAVYQRAIERELKRLERPEDR